jgi:hypothetical protein
MVAEESVSNLSFLQEIKLIDKQIVIIKKVLKRFMLQIYTFNNDKA